MANGEYVNRNSTVTNNTTNNRQINKSTHYKDKAHWQLFQPLKHKQHKFLQQYRQNLKQLR